VKPSILFTLPTIFSTSLSQENSFLMVTPMHLFASTIHLTRVYIVDVRCLFLCAIILITGYNVLLGNEAHLLCVSPNIPGSCQPGIDGW